MDIKGKLNVLYELVVYLLNSLINGPKEYLNQEKIYIAINSSFNSKVLITFLEQTPPFLSAFVSL